MFGRRHLICGLSQCGTMATVTRLFNQPSEGTAAS